MVRIAKFFIFSYWLPASVVVVVNGFASIEHAIYSGNVTVRDISEKCPNFKPEKLTPSMEKIIRFDIAIKLCHFIEIDSSSEDMSFTAIIDINWKSDECTNGHLFINHTGGLAKLFPDPHQFWKPNIYIIQSRDMQYVGGGRREEMAMTFQPANSLVDPNKPTISWNWSVMGEFRFHCELNLYRFPADVQNCTMRLQTKQSSELYAFNSCTFVEQKFSFVLENANWKLLALSCLVNNSLAFNQFSFSDISFQLQRIPTFHLFHLLGPCFILVVFEFCAFALPPKGADRSTYTMTIYLAFIFLESSLLSVIPQTHKPILLSDYILFQSIFSMLITIYSTFLALFCEKLEKKKVRFGGFTIRYPSLLDMLAFVVSLLAFAIETCYILLSMYDGYHWNYSFTRLYENSLLTQWL